MRSTSPIRRCVAAAVGKDSDRIRPESAIPSAMDLVKTCMILISGYSVDGVLAWRQSGARITRSRGWRTPRSRPSSGRDRPQTTVLNVIHEPGSLFPPPPFPPPTGGGGGGGGALPPGFFGGGGKQMLPGGAG